MNQLNNSNQGLMKIHKEMREITEETTKPGSEKGNGGGNEMNIENATVFVGYPTELMQKYGSAYEPKEGFTNGEAVEVNPDGNGTDDRSE